MVPNVSENLIVTTVTLVTPVFKLHIFCGGHKNSAHLPLFSAFLGSVKLEVEDGPNFCGLLRISELYVAVFQFPPMIWMW